jgi:glycosyltransferase involved in cell wall biosynthesis
MPQPLVSIICLCYNHARFVREAIDSVLHQTYPHLQIIVVDDASTDDSVAVIENAIAGKSNIHFLPLEKNLGNCAAFNRGLALATGEYVIDFATDDIMKPDRIVKQVDFFSALDPTFGVVFTDAEYIDKRGIVFRNHYEHLLNMRLITHIPQGDVYRDVLTTYFISSPTMMIRKRVFEEIGGYDEDLAYEDFDFWVRSSRLFNYAFLNEKLTQVRRLEKSMSTGFYVPGDKQLHSTYLVCKKAFQLNRTPEDKQALVLRVRYELRQSVFSENHVESELFYRLLENLEPVTLLYKSLFFLNKLRLPLGGLRKWYQHIRFGKPGISKGESR